MTWEVGAGWAGVIVSIVLGYLANHRSKATKREATEATERSREALASNKSMATSLDRIAESFGRLAIPGPQGPQGAPGSQGPQGHQGAPGAAVAQVRLPAWNIEYRNGQTYALRNVGSGPATRVTIDAGVGIARGLPDNGGVALDPGQAHPFMLIGAMGAPLPTDVAVRSEELAEQRVPVPAKSG
ncbi:MAG: hypothetical protein QOH56_381 [Pseudonocardiales bacterium]|jgi:hypothetical protein|nr:hypothetical protein [Pseudonocardiales bacterium]